MLRSWYARRELAALVVPTALALLGVNAAV
jgi:hypothetical protein